MNLLQRVGKLISTRCLNLCNIFQGLLLIMIRALQPFFIYLMSLTDSSYFVDGLSGLIKLIICFYFFHIHYTYKVVFD